MLRRENVFWADGDPAYRVTTYVPWSIAEGTGLLEEEVPHPCLPHVSVRADGEPYEATRFVMRGDMSSLIYNVPIE